MKSRSLSIAFALATYVSCGPCPVLHAQAIPPPPHPHEGQMVAADDRHAPEAVRVRRLRELIARREQLVRTQNTRELQACDAEIKTLPAPADSDARALSRALVGRWHSPRHDYLYRADGTWTLLPADEGILHGRWHITGNRLEQTSGYAAPESTTRYTLILLTAREYVFTDGETVFYDQRSSR